MALSLRAYLIMVTKFSISHSWGRTRRMLLAPSKRSEIQLNSLQYIGQFCTTKNYTVDNVSSAEIERPFSAGNSCS